MSRDPVIEKLLKVQLDYGEFSVEFVSKFLRHHKLLRENERSGVREIQPLFGWLLLQKQEINKGARIEIAPGIFVEPTADPLLEAYAGALFNLMYLLRKSPPTLTSVIIAATNVQRYSQEVFMRMTAGAQIMAVMYSNMYSGITPNKFHDASSPFATKVQDILNRVGIKERTVSGFVDRRWDWPSTRMVYAVDAVHGKIFVKDSTTATGWNPQKPFVPYTEFVNNMSTEAVKAGKTLDNLERVQSDVDGDDDSVVIDVKW